LFIPATAPNLRAVLSYYSSTVQVNAEGDVHVTGDTVEGLGKTQFPRTSFGSLFNLAKPQPRDPSLPHSLSLPFGSLPDTQLAAASKPATFPWDPGDQALNDEKVHHSAFIAENQLMPSEPGILTDLLPDPGVLVLLPLS